MRILSSFVFSVFTLLILHAAAAQPITQDPDIELQRQMFKAIEEHSYVSLDTLWFTPTFYPKNIAVCWENPDSGSDADKNLVIKSVADSWSKYSAVNFIGWQKCVSNNRGIRILISDDGPRTLGLGSQINGKKDGMLLNFTFTKWSPDCATSGEGFRQTCIKAIAIHEFGHALGFAHEQNRDDTPDWCKAQEPAQGGNGNAKITPWDPESVMNYCFDIYKPNIELSKYDKYTIAHFYGPHQ